MPQRRRIPPFKNSGFKLSGEDPLLPLSWLGRQTCDQCPGMPREVPPSAVDDAEVGGQAESEVGRMRTLPLRHLHDHRIRHSMTTQPDNMDIATLLHHNQQQLISVVTTIELSPPSQWLATTEPTTTSRCFTVFSAVFLGAVSWKLPLTIPQRSNSDLNAVSSDPAWMHGQSSGWHRPSCPKCPLPHSQRTGLLGQQGQSRHCS